MDLRYECCCHLDEKNDGKDGLPTCDIVSPHACVTACVAACVTASHRRVATDVGGRTEARRVAKLMR